jgi:hypothetical protein
MGFRSLVRDQEVEGSNPFAPTNLSRFNNLRFVFNFRFCLVRGDNTDNIGDLGRKCKTQAHRFCLFQTECDIFFHLAIAVSHGLIFMSHPKELLSFSVTACQRGIQRESPSNLTLGQETGKIFQRKMFHVLPVFFRLVRRFLLDPVISASQQGMWFWGTITLIKCRDGML